MKRVSISGSKLVEAEVSIIETSGLRGEQRAGGQDSYSNHSSILTPRQSVRLCLNVAGNCFFDLETI